MCTYPPALFESSGLPRQANKPALADAMWDFVGKEQTLPQRDCQIQYVIDGGALIQHTPWPRGFTYDGICKLYADYVTRRYGRAVIVFDGYRDEASVKDVTHKRRTGARIGATVKFSSDMVFRSKKDEFLSNKVNKQRFIHLVAEKLEREGCITDHAKEDADVLIVQTAIEFAKTKNTILVGDDTDLLVLLCYHADMCAKDIFFQPEPKQGDKRKRIWNIKETKAALGQEVCSNLLFLHAVLGCDTS